MKKTNPQEPYTYYFADGTASTVNVGNIGEEWLAVINEMKDDDRRKNYNYKRHNYQLSALDFEGGAFIDASADPFERCVCNMEQERIDAAVSTLSKRQREVFELRYYDKKKQEEIAAELGITHQAVSVIYGRAKRNLQRIFRETFAKQALSSLYSEGV